MIRILAGLILCGLVSINGYAQDTLPKFTVISKGNNRTVISWTNIYRHTSQISIQRSFDSTRNFKTILTVPDPTVPQNGFVDTKATTPFMFYRLFIVLDSGKYVFSRSSRPSADTVKTSGTAGPVLMNDNGNKRVLVSDSMSNREMNELRENLQPANPAVPNPEKFFVVYRKDTLLADVAEKNLKKFRDSIVYSTRDTIVFRSSDTILIKPFIPKEVYKASKYVFTEKYGNVMISLPDVDAKKYSISFFEDNKTALFEIRQVKASPLILDKANFVHAGWFWFELYENGTLKEKHRFYIPKDF